MMEGRKDRYMRPMDPDGQADQAGDKASDSFDTWRALQRATDKKRADILADIVGHPEGMPSVEELDYMNPPLSEDAIRRHLNALIEVGVVKKVELETGERYRDYPYQFYTLTADARALFDQNGLFPEVAWQRQYDAVEKTQRIIDIETMPRPD